MAKKASASANIEGFAAAAQAAIAEFRANLSTLRDEIRSLKMERDHLVTMPVDVATAHARIDAWVESMIHVYDQEGGMAWFFVRPENRYESPGLRYNFQSKAARYLLRSMGEQLRTEVEQYLQKHGMTHTINEADRGRLLAILDGKIDRLEADEERLIRAAEAAGLVAPRRSDASGKALLVADDDHDDDDEFNPEDLTEEDHAALADFETKFVAQQVKWSEQTRPDDDGHITFDVA